MEAVCDFCEMALNQEGEYHPEAACLMYMTCGDADTVRSHLAVIAAHGVERELKWADQVIEIDDEHG